jgi:hypothetical protein
VTDGIAGSAVTGRRYGTALQHAEVHFGLAWTGQYQFVGAPVYWMCAFKKYVF